MISGWDVVMKHPSVVWSEDKTIWSKNRLAVVCFFG